MDEDRIKGSAQKIKGDLKDSAGKALGAKVASEAFSNASAMDGDAANKAKHADAAATVTEAAATVTEAAATVTERVKQLLDRQVGSGADMMGHVAGAVRRAAQELDRDAPQFAGMVRSAAEQMNGYADGLRDQSLEQLMREASDFTRRQPAVVFGLSALAGFLVLRTLKSSPSSVASPIQPTGYGRR